VENTVHFFLSYLSKYTMKVKRFNKSKQNNTNSRRKKRSTIDSWDTGKEERLKHSNIAPNEKRVKLEFNPQKPIFICQSPEEALTTRIGPFGGPLLSALLIPQEDEVKLVSKLVKPKFVVDETLTRGNPFAILDSDEEDVSYKQSDGGVKWKPATFTVPTTYVINPLPETNKGYHNAWNPLPPIFDPSLVQTTTSKFEFNSKPTSFILPTTSNSYLTNEDEDDL
jgi:hypothetical protein